METYYDILGVPEDADDDLLDDAMREMQKVHHPDRGGSVEMSANINVAYDTLSDPVERAAYDRKLRAERSRPTASADAGSASATPPASSASDPWDDWDTYVPGPTAGESTPEASSPDATPTHWLRGPMGTGQRLLGIFTTIVLTAFTLLFGSLVLAYISNLAGIDSGDHDSITFGLVVTAGFLAVGILAQFVTWFAHRRRQKRRPTFRLSRYPSRGVVFVTVSAVLVTLIAMAALPLPGPDDDFPHVDTTAAALPEPAPSIPADEPPVEIPGAPLAAATCTTSRSPAGRLLPDPDCTPGVVSTAATVDALCAKGYQALRPTDAAITQARTMVARAYAKKGAKADPKRVAFLIPPRLGGTWNLQNLWTRGALMASSTIDKVLARLCAPGSTLTLDEVHAAAVRNDLIALVPK